MPVDYKTIKIHKHNFNDYFKTPVTFDTITNLVIQGKPPVRTATKMQLGLSSSFIQVNYYYMDELLTIATAKLKSYEISNPKNIRHIEKIKRGWMTIRDKSEIYLNKEAI